MAGPPAQIGRRAAVAAGRLRRAYFVVNHNTDKLSMKERGGGAKFVTQFERELHSSYATEKRFGAPVPPPPAGVPQGVCLHRRPPAIA